SIRYKGRISKFMLGMLVTSFIVLGYLGTIPPSPFATFVAQVGTMLYFSYFLLMPWYTRREKTKAEPERVTG
ncbi:MAG: cytochrome b, partial [Gammaproteobacteria bacterium]|nr:cytochrome b [Gammaproteobacteria bacterium]